MRSTFDRGLGTSRAWVSFCASVCMMVAGPSVSYGQEVTVTGRTELSSSAVTQPVDSSEVLVWLTPLGDSREIRSASIQQPPRLVQRQKSFSPHLLVVRVGSPVEFPNQDPFFHNVFSLFEGKRFDLGLYEAGSSRNVVFDRAGISYIFCNIHAEMSAVVVALKTPYYGISDRKGMIVIPSVPPGRYEMRVWHERVLPEALNSFTRTILISEGSHSFGALRLTEERNLAKSHMNKYGQDYDNPTPSLPVYPHP